LTAASKIKAGFGAGFALLLGLCIAAVVQTLQWEESSRAVANTNDAIDRIAELSFQSKDADDSARRFIANLDRLDLARSREALSQANERETELEGLIAGPPASSKAEASVRQLVEQQAAILLPALASPKSTSADSTDVARALAAIDKAGLSSNLRAALLDLESEERLLLRSRTAMQRQTAGLSRVLFTFASVFSLALIVVAGWRMSTEQSKRGAAEKALAAKDEQYRRVVELAGDMIFRTDAQGRFTFCNQALLSLLHLSRQEVIGRSYLKFIRQEKRRTAERFYIRQFARKQRNSYYEFPIVDGHGHERWVGQNVQLVIEGSAITGFQAIARDITDRKRTEAALQKSRNFVERIAATTPGILYVYDLVERRNIFTNREIVEILGYKPEELEKAMSFAQMAFHPDDQAMINAHHEAMRRAQDGEVRRLEYRLRHAAGHWVWLSGRQTPFERGPDGLVKQVVGIAQDITTGKAAQERLAWQANYDALTGLSNRHHFWTSLQSALRRASIEHSGVALCIFDVDHFKETNDRYGHAAGDEVLEAIGTIVRGELRSVDVAGRLGGDEFCFALPRTDGNECARVAERIRERLCTMAFGLTSGTAFSVSATFGVAEFEPHMDAKALTEAADRALYRAKSAGRNRVGVEI
jgi:diguanylate cyclase (GGDEF)-like protein/PAS domain S-box-containing protein